MWTSQYFRKLCGVTVVMLGVVLICAFVTGSDAKVSIRRVAAAKGVFHSASVKRVGGIAGRSATDTHGRTLIFKSLILAPLAMVVFILMLVLLIPIPVISGRMLPSSTFEQPMQLAKQVLTAEECIERVSCELSRLSRSYSSTSWMPATLEKYLNKSKWSDRIVRGIKGREESCSKFTCSPAKSMRRSLKMD